MGHNEVTLKKLDCDLKLLFSLPWYSTDTSGQRRHWRATETGVRTEDGLEGAGSEGNPGDQHPVCLVWWLSGDEILPIYIGFGMRHKDPVMNQSVEWNVREKIPWLFGLFFLGGATSKIAYGKLWLQRGWLV